MKLKHHITISLFFSAFLFAISKSWIIFTSSLISGVLIDCDHIFDYFWEFRNRFSVKEFFDVYYNGKMLFSMIVFHSWELLALLSICAFSMSWNPWIIGTTIGLTQHVVLDQIFNKPSRCYKPSRWIYFFFWRLKYGFNMKKMFPKLDCYSCQYYNSSIPPQTPTHM
jgi:hypothetical protein